MEGLLARVRLDEWLASFAVPCPIDAHHHFFRNFSPHKGVTRRGRQPLPIDFFVSQRLPAKPARVAKTNFPLCWSGVGGLFSDIQCGLNME